VAQRRRRLGEAGDDFLSWQQRHFGLAPDASSVPLADPDGDGVVNLLEYAFASDPRRADAEGRPAIVSTQGSWGYTFFRARSDLHYVVQSSSDLAAWKDEATDPGRPPDHVTFALEAEQPDAPRFWRLKVSK
jgi:hypothetical protein